MHKDASRSESQSRHDGHFWIGLAERIEDGRYSVDRIVFGEEPSDEEIPQFVASKYAFASETVHQTL